MKKILTLAILFSTSAALAKFTNPDDVAALPEAPSATVFEAGGNSALQLTIGSTNSGFDDSSTDGVNGDSERAGSEECSGTAISKDGYVLTALHCLATCSSALNRKTTPGDKNGDYVFYEANTDAIRSGRASCAVRVQFKNKSRSVGSAQIIAIGRGYIERGNTAKSQVIANLVSQGVGPMNDYAILKFKKNPADSCLPVSSAVTGGERVWNMAYPSKTSRRYVLADSGKDDKAREKAENAPGEKVVFSSGVIQNTASILVSTIDVVPSSSGSGLFDYGGHLVGLTNSVSLAANVFNQEIPGIARSTPLSHIIADATAIYGSAVVNQAFNCY